MLYSHIQLYTYISKYMRNIIKRNIRTSMNERIHFFIKIYLSHFILERVDVPCVWEMNRRQGQLAILTQVLLTIAALLPHLGWVAQLWVTVCPKPSVCRWLSLRHLVSNCLEPSVHLVILLFNIHLLPLSFRLFTHVHFLIDSSVEGQYIIIIIIIIIIILIIIVIIITKKKRICKIVDFAVPADHRIKLKECEKKDKYLDLARELKKLRNMKVTIVPILIGAFGTITKGLLKGLEDLEVGGRVETIQMTEHYWEQFKFKQFSLA